MTLVWHDLTGRSMWPLGAPMQAGVAPVVARTLQVGDMIAFIADDAPVLWLHRVVRVAADAVVTRGDTNGFDDPPVPLSAVLGRVEAVRIGALVLPLPHSGRLGALHRRAGIAWSHFAPGLRRLRAVRGWARKGA